MKLAARVSRIGSKASRDWQQGVGEIGRKELGQLASRGSAKLVAFSERNGLKLDNRIVNKYSGSVTRRVLSGILIQFHYLILTPTSFKDDLISSSVTNSG